LVTSDGYKHGRLGGYDETLDLCHCGWLGDYDEMPDLCQCGWLGDYDEMPDLCHCGWLGDYDETPDVCHCGWLGDYDETHGLCDCGCPQTTSGTSKMPLGITVTGHCFNGAHPDPKSRHVTSHHAASHHVTSRQITLHHVTSHHHTTSHHDTARLLGSLACLNCLVESWRPMRVGVQFQRHGKILVFLLKKNQLQ
jgi:hypothetical protein